MVAAGERLDKGVVLRVRVESLRMVAGPIGLSEGLARDNGSCCRCCRWLKVLVGCWEAWYATGFDCEYPTSVDVITVS